MGDELNLGGAGEDLAAGDAFEPSEDELLLHFLRPQLRGFAPRVVGAVAEADPCDAAPWELVARHGRRGGHGAYLFAARDRRRPCVRRSVPGPGGGCWLHSSTRKGSSVTLLGAVVRWCMLRFCFYTRCEDEERGSGGGQPRSTGWVMSEYQITDPRCYRRADDGEEGQYWVLCHIRKSKTTTKKSPAAGKTTASRAYLRGLEPPST